MPTVSVIMPTYNTDKMMITESIQSILRQSFNDFEFIIIDDGSVNYQDSEFIKSSYHDNRIKIIQNEKNSGVAYSLNRGLQIAQGKYIVRMDSDDIANKNRIEELVNLMESKNDVIVAGSNAKCFGSSRSIMRYPESDSDIRAEMIFNNPFCHPTVIMRREFLEKHRMLYPENVSNEDFALWVKIASHKEAKFYNIQKCLLKYRVHKDQVTQKNRTVLNKDAIIYHGFVFKAIGLENMTTDEIELFMNAVNGSKMFSKGEAFSFGSICKMIIRKADSLDDKGKKSLLRTVAKHYKKFYVKQRLIYKNRIIEKDKDLGKVPVHLLIDLAYKIA